jgi:hypothetical protein
MSSRPQPGGDRPTVNERLLRTSREAIELWFDAAKWWTGAVVDSSGVWRGDTGKAAPETSTDLAYGFVNRPVDAELDGRRLQAELRSIQLRRGGRDGGQLELGDVDWDGLSSESLSIVAREVTVTPATMTLALTGVEIRGSVSFTQLVAWGDRRTPRWQLGVVESGSIAAVSLTGGRRVCFVPSIEAGELVMELREVGWRLLRAPLPRWLRLTRTAAMPPLPEGVEILEATRKGESVEFVLGLPSFTAPLDLHGLLTRDAADGVES